MSSIKDLGQSNTELAANQRKMVEKRTNELRAIEQKYVLSEKEAKAQADSRMIEIKNQNQLQLAAELESKETKLGDLKNSLNETQEILNTQVNQLNNSRVDRETERRLLHESRMQNLQGKHTEESQLLNEKFNKEMQDINDHARSQEVLTRQKLNREANTLRREYSSTINRDHKDFQEQKFNQDVQNHHALQNQASRHKHETVTKENTHLTKMAGTDIRHMAEEQTTEKQHQLTTEQTRKDFETKYQTILAGQNENLKTLQDQVDHNIAKMNLHESKQKAVITEKSKDVFYQGNVVKTSVIEKQDHYLVKVPVAPHEAALVNLTGKDRNLKLSLSRMSEKEVKAEDGSINKTKRSESMVKELQVEQIINPKKIEKTYENGEVIYKIAKL